tara:strand:- start:190 stop:363 length:174 start_codon:yes stop_codon:yes gene_type:complete
MALPLLVVELAPTLPLLVVELTSTVPGSHRSPPVEAMRRFCLPVSTRHRRRSTWKSP